MNPATPIHALLLPLMESPLMPALAQELQQHLQAERQKREAFYQWVTEDIKAEFISGEVVMHSPVTDAHERASGGLYTLMNIHVVLAELGRVAHEKFMISLTRNDFEPDICFFGPEKAADFQPDQKLFPAPDMVVEVLSKSTEKADRGIKMQDYAAHGVQEYWLVEPVKHVIEQYVLRQGVFELVQAHSAKTRIRSHVVTGFEIPVAALFNQEIFRETLKGLQG